MKPRKPPPQPIRDMFAPTPATFVDLRERPQKRNNRSNWTPNRQRLSEVTNLIQHRHKGHPCDTDDGEVYLRAALPALIEEAGGMAASDCGTRIRTWARITLPLMTSAEVAACIDQARERNTRRKLHWTARELGDLLSVSVAEREALNLRMIRPAGMTDPEFRAYTRARDAARKKADRAAAGARPQERRPNANSPGSALGSAVGPITGSRPLAPCRQLLRVVALFRPH